MKYAALLRGINVGGNSIIKMADLKNALTECGFIKVSTYIQSGNVIFESEENNSNEILKNIEGCLSTRFSYNSTIILKNFEQLKKIVAEVPGDWNKRSDLRCYVAFIGGQVSIRDIVRDIKLKEGIDFLKAGEGVLYMSTLLSGLTKSSYTKLAALPVYKDISIRNYNTTRKLLTLME
jgi:uncharacterized protein (DUF1697 family)